MLDADKSVFVDFQKVRIQETQAELPRGCIPRSLEVILRAEAVESVQVIDSIFLNVLNCHLTFIYENVREEKCKFVILYAKLSEWIGMKTH